MLVVLVYAKNTKNVFIFFNVTKYTIRLLSCFQLKCCSQDFKSRIDFLRLITTRPEEPGHCPRNRSYQQLNTCVIHDSR